MKATPARFNRVNRLFTQPLEVAMTAVAFVLLHHYGLLGRLPVTLILSLLVVAGLGQRIVHAGLSGRDDRRALHIRLAVEAAGATAVIYAIGWGPTLAIGYVVVVAEDLRLSGSAAWRPAIVWNLAAMAGGQLAIFLGWVPTYVATPYVHGLAVLAGLGLAFVIRLLGMKTEEREREAAERSRAETALRQSEERFRSLVQNSSDVITVVDDTGTITYVTPSIERVLGYRPDELVGTSGFGHIHPDDVAAAEATLTTLLEHDGDDCIIEVRGRHADGSWRWHEVVLRNLLTDPAVRGIVANHRDITDRKAYQERLAHQASHDALTGLANRGAFLERLDAALSRARRHDRRLAVLFVDLDGFKAVNDALGHDLGDLVLEVIARRLASCLRPEDTAARFAGDEFTVLLEDLTDPGGATAVADRITAEIRRPILLTGRPMSITASVGAAYSTGEEETADELLRSADLAMYEAKRGGRDRLSVLGQAAVERVRRRGVVERELAGALDAAQLCLHYQPVVDLRTGSTVAVETLLRWSHPLLGQVMPAEFIPVAESTGAIVDIGRWVLLEACRTVQAWREEGLADRLGLSVNVSVAQLAHPAFIDDVAHILAVTNFPANELTLEITESMLIGDGDEALSELRALKRLGVRLALDDFGAGYSSLSYLGRLPLDAVKVDRSIVDQIDFRAEQAFLMRAVTGLARVLGVDVVAEGVERADQVSALRRARCPMAQGYHFSRPLTAAETSEMLQARRPSAAPAVALTTG
jgi:diguanylate cyclase (GGDEF)-like protein/PAS domain S-box-containing protein